MQGDKPVSESVSGGKNTPSNAELHLDFGLLPELFAGERLKVAGTSGRVVPLPETEKKLDRLLDLIPITRVADLTPLDPLGLPVFSAVTPLALDLTSHAGKGTSLAGARVSALMEAVERVSAERVSSPTVRASYEDLHAEVAKTDCPTPPIDPQLLTLPADSAWSRESPFTWTKGFDLTTGAELLLPIDVVVNPPCEGILRSVDTNGLASGNTLLEAVIHGLCEVIERDIQSRLEFCHLFAAPDTPGPELQLVELESLPTEAREWVRRIRDFDLDLILQHISGELGVPSFRCLLLDPAYPSPSGATKVRFGGWGTAPSAEQALLRSITEAVQSRVSWIQAARDSYNNPPRRQRSDRNDRMPWTTVARRIDFDSVPSFESRDLAADLTFLQDRLATNGFKSIWVVDLTRPEWQIPVARVRVPGLSSFYVNRRRIGRRCLRYLL